MEPFIAHPQGQLAGTSMPRVGLNPEGYDKVEALFRVIDACSHLIISPTY